MPACASVPPARPAAKKPKLQNECARFMMRRPTSASVRSASTLRMISIEPTISPTGSRSRKKASGSGACTASANAAAISGMAARSDRRKPMRSRMRRGEGQRHQRADRHADQPEAERALLDAHGVLDVGQPREDVAEAERIDGEAGIDPVLRRQSASRCALEIPPDRPSASRSVQPCRQIARRGANRQRREPDWRLSSRGKPLGSAPAVVVLPGVPEGPHSPRRRLNCQVSVSLRFPDGSSRPGTRAPVPARCS